MDPHPVEFRAGSCSYVRHYPSVLMAVESPEPGAPSVYDEVQWPPQAVLVAGPGAPWAWAEDTQRVMVADLATPPR